MLYCACAGVYGLPHCLGEEHRLCDYMRRLLNYGAYTSWIQSMLVQVSEQNRIALKCRQMSDHERI